MQFGVFPSYGQFKRATGGVHVAVRPDARTRDPGRSRSRGVPVDAREPHDLHAAVTVGQQICKISTTCTCGLVRFRSRCRRCGGASSRRPGSRTRPAADTTWLTSLFLWDDDRLANLVQLFNRGEVESGKTHTKIGVIRLRPRIRDRTRRRRPHRRAVQSLEYPPAAGRLFAKLQLSLHHHPSRTRQGALA